MIRTMIILCNSMTGFLVFIFLSGLVIGGSHSNDVILQTIGVPVEHDVNKKTVVISSGNKTLCLRLNYNYQCVLDQVWINDEEVISTNEVYSGIKVSDTWHTTRSGIATPTVNITNNVVTVKDINFGGGGIDVSETWTLTPDSNSITLAIDRKYYSSGVLEDMCMPCWDFDITTWTGALLGNGGVAWCKLFDTPNSTYGVHTGKVTFWNKENDACLRIVPESQPGNHIACKFSRRANDLFAFNQYITENELSTKYDNYRFFEDKQDIWKPFQISNNTISVIYTLTALSYDKEYDRGSFTYFDGESIRSILNTIARVGVIDSYLHGSNSWRTPYGPAVLHEQWIALMGLAIDDPAYFNAYKNTLDFQRDHAIEKDGRIKSRWAYHDGDAMSGTYDSLGFYECQWGYLLDSQPDFVINVAELYDLNGDLEWVQTHKVTCEKVLEYLLRRDSDGDCLVEMMTDYHTEAKGSDWIDVIWAAYENAFVNAEMYYALILWADIELQLGDNNAASRYLNFAQCLKNSFNKTTNDCGFWDPVNQWYVYWRDKDNTIHGNNLVTPVNFMAIAYGLCDDVSRRNAILDQIEQEMQRENLFCWPLCIYPYEDGEGLKRVNFPFPNYENGDIFLAWGELGVRAYAEYNPQIPIKYIRKVMEKYEQDGLAFQRYLRKTQTGKGDDILANNCNPIVGLYRDIYGIQPKYNRLYLNPHLIDELNGTQLKYWLRNQMYIINLNTNDYSITANNFRLQANSGFAMNTEGKTVQYFHGHQKTCSMSISKSVDDLFVVVIEKWKITDDYYKRWSVSCTGADASVEYSISDLEPNKEYMLYNNGKLSGFLSCDSAGCTKFAIKMENNAPQIFEIKSGN